MTVYLVWSYDTITKRQHLEHIFYLQIDAETAVITYKEMHPGHTRYWIQEKDLE